MGGLALTTIEEAKIIAYVIRGDSTTQIQQQLAQEGRENVSPHTITAVKIRNADTLTRLRDITLKKEMADAAAIKHKANRVINTQLNNLERNAAILEKAGQEYVDGEITLAEYKELRRSLKAPTMQELVVVSKEMHAQSSAEPDAPINPEDASAITAALEAGDEVKLTQLVFKKGGTVKADA